MKKVLTSKSVDDINEFKTEIRIMQTLFGKYKDYILQYINYESIEDPGTGTDDKPKLYFYSEYCDLGSLGSFIRSKQYNKEQNTNILKHILQGLCYLYDESIIHSDIHPGNILVQQLGDKIIFKIADFGKGSILLEESGKLNLTALPSGSVLMYIFFSTYFRDLHGWFTLVLHLYHSYYPQSCSESEYGFFSPDVVLYPINFGSPIEQKLIQLLYKLQTDLINKAYKARDHHTVHEDILGINNNYIYGLVDEKPKSCVRLVAPKNDDSGNSALIHIKQKIRSLIEYKYTKKIETDEFIDIKTDRAIYEPVYNEIKRILDTE